MTIITGIWLLWLAYAGYRLWTATSRPIIRIVAIVLVSSMFVQAVWNLVEQNQTTGLSPFTPTTATVVPGIVTLSSEATCTNCTTEKTNRLLLTGDMATGRYILVPEGNQPYSLSFSGGKTIIDGAEIDKGCRIGTLKTRTIIRFTGATGVRLEVGPDAACE
jgi:hypothetical protein